MLPTITSDTIDLAPGSEVILRYQTWEDYEQLLHTRQNRAGLRIFFSATTQEIRIMAPLPKHGKQSAILTDLVKYLLRHTHQEWDSYDPITLKRFRQKGLEPDHCFYIQNRNAVLGKDEINLESDPPPDLALEVDLTSLTQPEDYDEIGVPELWIYRQATLYIYSFDGQRYHEQSASRLFPTIPVKEIIPTYVEQAWKQGSSVALKDFESYIVRNYSTKN
ncbi:MAG: Uma2 family endonuclease [Leptolyngbyaceae bacterium]|nr:Uma2 family endonuclease [Leptolyngbyaceae bacterium]